METIQLEAVKIHFDSSETRRAYERIASDPHDECTCEACQNWNSCGIASLPSDFLDLLDTLGINANYPAEIYHVLRIQPGLHVYAGWFHFVGCLASPGRNATNSLMFGSCSITLHSNVQFASERFSPLALTQLEFSANAPWVRSAPEPE